MSHRNFKLMSLVIVFLLVNGLTYCGALYPVILIPGDGGSQLEAKLDKPAVVHYACTKKTTDFYNVWLNLELLAPVIIDCWVDNVRLVYNKTTRTTSNSPGVEIRVPNFGNSTVVEYLDPSKASSGLYFNQIVQGSLLPLGYLRNSTVRGAPYDFRKAPNEMADWMVDFKALVEESYESNGKKGAIFICHSMGAPLALYFLHRQSQSWKDKYVRALVTLGGAWYGSVKAVRAFSSVRACHCSLIEIESHLNIFTGDDLGAYLLPSLKMRGEQRTCPSTAWLLPSKKMWNDNDVLISIDGFPNKNYTRGSMERFFQDINLPEGYEMLKDTENLLGNMDPPGVDLYCLHGTGVSTVESLRYKDVKSFPDKPIDVNGNGDGTVNIQSLRGCLRWQDSGSVNSKSKVGNTAARGGNRSSGRRGRNETRNKNGQQVFHEEFSGVDHMQILSDPKVLLYLKNMLGSLNQE